jgi:hypothetical protein
VIGSNCRTWDDLRYPVTEDVKTLVGEPFQSETLALTLKGVANDRGFDGPYSL